MAHYAWRHRLFFFFTLALGSMGCSSDHDRRDDRLRLFTYRDEKLVARLSPHGYRSSSIVGAWQDETGERIYILEFNDGVFSVWTLALGDPVPTVDTQTRPNERTWVNRNGDVVEFPGIAQLARTSGYYFGEAFRYSSLDDPLWRFKIGNAEFRPNQIFVQGGKIYLHNTGGLRMGEAFATRGDNCLVLKPSAEGFIVDRWMRIPGVIEAVDPSSDRIVIRDVVDMPFWTRKFVLDVSTGKKQFLKLYEPEHHFFLKGDILGRVRGKE